MSLSGIGTFDTNLFLPHHTCKIIVCNQQGKTLTTIFLYIGHEADYGKACLPHAECDIIVFLFSIIQYGESAT